MPVNERVQEAPVGTLRAAFAGIGRFLKITDKIRSKPTAGEAPAEAKATATAQTAPKAAAPEAPAAAAAPEVAVETPADTVTADAVPESDAAPESAVSPEATVEPETTATAEATATAEPAAEAATEVPAEVATGVAAGELPLANYDTLTIASVRARLRNLSIAELGQLVDYEKSHANRDDFIAAFERRIAKVQSES
jgi:hypothetical protein